MNQCKTIRTKLSFTVASIFMIMIFILFKPLSVQAAGVLNLSTDYPGIFVKAGDNLSFDMNIYNGLSGTSVELAIKSAPEGWDGYFSGNGSQINQAYAKSGDNLSIATFYVSVPFDTKQGTYQIVLAASDGDTESLLTLTLDVSEEDLGSSNLTTQYA